MARKSKRALMHVVPVRARRYGALHRRSEEMNDRELLELAAKAAGVKTGKHRAIKDGLLMENDLYWNPLADDGDALRLAVKMGMDVRCAYFHTLEQSHAASVSVGDVIWGGVAVDEPPKYYTSAFDTAAATRRAIVRAAASIGQQK